jgi:hypothetical protein
VILTAPFWLSLAFLLFLLVVVVVIADHYLRMPVKSATEWICDRSPV